MSIGTRKRLLANRRLDCFRSKHKNARHLEISQASGEALLTKAARSGTAAQLWRGPERHSPRAGELARPRKKVSLRTPTPRAGEIAMVGKYSRHVSKRVSASSHSQTRTRRVTRERANNAQQQMARRSVFSKHHVHAGFQTWLSPALPRARLSLAKLVPSWLFAEKAAVSGPTQSQMPRRLVRARNARNAIGEIV